MRKKNTGQLITGIIQEDNLSIKTLKCILCTKSFSKMANMRQHLRNIHKEDTSNPIANAHMKCPVCTDYAYARTVELFKHLATDHGIRLEIDHNTFTTTTEFYKWKSEMEAEYVCVKDPPETKFGGIRQSWTGSHKLASLVDYHCINDSMSPVVVRLHCTYKRKWEIKQINNETCKCDFMPPPLPGTFVKYSSARISSVVTYHCDSEFQTLAVQVIQCSILKKWVVLSTNFTDSCLS
uniref:C2H2-type domain-containing protein n=1 Tax=Strigamia maritima TaxID=126957 RepID=T1JEM1_STRMM